MLACATPTTDASSSGHGGGANGCSDTCASWYGKLRLQINEAKSAVTPVWDRDFLGYSMWVAPGKVVRLRVAKKTLDELRGRVRPITGRQGGRSMTAVVGELRSYLTG